MLIETFQLLRRVTKKPDKVRRMQEARKKMEDETFRYLVFWIILIKFWTVKRYTLRSEDERTLIFRKSLTKFNDEVTEIASFFRIFEDTYNGLNKYR